MERNKKVLTCAAYLKPMDRYRDLYEQRKLSFLDLETQKTHLRQWSEANGIPLSRLYEEPTSDATTAFLALCEDAVHRKFDAIAVDSLNVFGRSIFSAADYMREVLIPAGFRIFILEDGMDSTREDFPAYLTHIKNRNQSLCALIARTQGTATRKPTKREVPLLEITHDLAWYEARQKFIFAEMLAHPENFDALERELTACRAAIQSIGRNTWLEQAREKTSNPA